MLDIGITRHNHSSIPVENVLSGAVSPSAKLGDPSSKFISSVSKK